MQESPKGMGFPRVLIVILILFVCLSCVVLGWIVKGGIDVVKGIQILQDLPRTHPATCVAEAVLVENVNRPYYYIVIQIIEPLEIPAGEWEVGLADVPAYPAPISAWADHDSDDSLFDPSIVQLTPEGFITSDIDGLYSSEPAEFELRYEELPDFASDSPMVTLRYQSSGVICYKGSEVLPHLFNKIGASNE